MYEGNDGEGEKFLHVQRKFLVEVLCASVEGKKIKKIFIWSDLLSHEITKNIIGTVLFKMR